MSKDYDFTRDEVQGQIEELLERFAAQGHGEKMFGMTLVEALMDLMDDVALHPYVVPDVEPVDDGSEIFFDWSKSKGWRAICSKHGVLHHKWPPDTAEEVEHDYTIILAWDHDRRYHFGGDYITGPQLLNPEKWVVLMNNLRRQPPAR